MSEEALRRALKECADSMDMARHVKPFEWPNVWAAVIAQARAALSEGQAPEPVAQEPGGIVGELAGTLPGSKVDWEARLPDGSGAAVLSMPLRADHWLTQQHDNVPPMPLRMGAGPERDAMAVLVRQAARYAVRCATMNGTEDDFDPDALVQNMVVGLLGYWTEDGTSKSCGDPYDNPNPIPPLFSAGMDAARAKAIEAPFPPSCWCLGANMGEHDDDCGLRLATKGAGS